MRKYFLILVIVWAVMIIGAFLFNMHVLEKNSETLVQTKSEAFFKLLVTTRLWNANHGLVYVPVSKTMQPNPYLIHSQRDVITNFGDSLTLVNPAFMTRQLAELAEESKVTGFHITSLNPIRPANKPDEWESKALQTFKGVDDKFFEKIETGDSITFRYMAPLIVGQGCLACHASQGYRLGDVRGGISIDTPYHKDYLDYARASSGRLITIYSLIFLVGFFLLLYFRSSSRQHKRDVDTKNKQLVDLNAAKDKFFSVIAHDLKTPAANIESLSAMLQEQFDDLDNDDRKSCINMLVESAKTHNELLNTLLDLSRLRLGSKQYSPEQVDICKLVNDVLEQTRLQAQQKQIGQTSQAGGCFARADRNMITTVVRNIVVNAIKFTHPGGQIVIRAEKENTDVVISIADTGVGIADSVRDRIFEADYNKSTAGTANESGTGLGLVLCKEYVERNGGRIWFESESGIGTTFFFTLPAF
jgi:signal transduction histidine kinase